MINKCCICGEDLKTIHKIPNKDIIGMASDYIQLIGLCPHCELIITQNPFPQNLLTNRYKHNSKFEYDDNDDIFEENDEYVIRMKRIKFFIDETVGLNNISSIFEVGAASGFNLSLYKKKEVYGVEPSQVNVSNAKKRYGIDLFSGDFDEFLNTKPNSYYNKFDLIFLSMTLEHIVNPCDFVKKLRVFNKKYMFIEVPTFDMKFNDEPYGMFCEEHVNMFTLKSLQKLMNSCGYQLIDASIRMQNNTKLPAGVPAIDSIWEQKNEIKEFSIINEVQSLLKIYIKESQKKLQVFNHLLNTFPNKKKLAVWGTGHHASMLYSNTTLSQKNIVKVYDSDTRKHGLDMFGCKIEPFNEKDIFEENIDGILVATYTARNALMKILYPYKDKVEILDLYKE